MFSGHLSYELHYREAHNSLVNFAMNSINWIIDTQITEKRPFTSSVYGAYATVVGVNGKKLR